jgi:hypothetical protein
MILSSFLGGKKNHELKIGRLFILGGFAWISFARRQE